MQISQTIAGIEAAVEAQLAIASPEAAEYGSKLMAALEPALQRNLVDLLCAAATEISSQIPGYSIDVRMVDGETELVVTASTPPPPPSSSGSDDEARITVRLPGYLKDLIAEAASTTGDSVNAFVVDALHNQAHTTTTSKKGRVNTTVEF